MGIGIGTGLNRADGNGDGFAPNLLSTSFDGVDERVNINGVQTALDATTVGTWTLWCKPVDPFSVAAQMLITFGDTDANNFFQLLIAAGGLLQSACRSGAGVQWNVDSDAQLFFANTWTHVGIVQPNDGSGVQLYGNGLPLAQTFITSTDLDFWLSGLSGLLDNARLGVTTKSGTDGFFYNGLIDEPRFWNRALSDADMLDDYNSGVPKLPNQTGLITNYRMGDNDTFPTITDNADGNDGTMINMEAGDFTSDTP